MRLLKEATSGMMPRRCFRSSLRAGRGAERVVVSTFKVSSAAYFLRAPEKKKDKKTPLLYKLSTFVAYGLCCGPGAKLAQVGAEAPREEGGERLQTLA